MARSEITHCLIRNDIFELPEIFSLSAEEKAAFVYAILQGSKNNLGIFTEHRGGISFKIGAKGNHEPVHNLFLNEKLFGFDQKTHTIWIKDFYDYVEFGVLKPVFVERKVKDTKEKKTGLDFNSLKRKNGFISKIKSTFRDNPALLVFKKPWIERNFDMLCKLNEEAHSVKGNKYNLDEFLKLSTGV